MTATTPVSGLEPSTTYHYRLVANSAGGTTYGADQTLKTFHGVTPDVIHEGNTWWVYYQGSDAALWEWYFNGSTWNNYRVGGAMWRWSLRPTGVPLGVIVTKTSGKALGLVIDCQSFATAPYRRPRSPLMLDDRVGRDAPLRPSANLLSRVT